MQQLPEGWKLVDSALVREWKFADFAEALAFMNKVGEKAEKLNHHPDIYNSYNRVRLELRTHDTDAVTVQDYGLAEAINTIK